MNLYNEKLFNEQVEEYLSIYRDPIDEKWLRGENGNIYYHLDGLLYEKFEMKFGFIDENESKPYLKYLKEEPKLFNESPIPRVAYMNLVIGVINEIRKLYKEFDV